MLVFDDIIYKKALLKLAGEVFIRGRHLNISAIIILQNLFFPDKDFRQISLNITHAIILRNRDMRQILSFGGSFLSKDMVKKFADLYKRVVESKKYGHLLIDFTQDSDSPLMFRSEIVSDIFERAYIL